jgi:CO dehydrogenase maturation factor
LAVDADPDANLASSLGIPPERMAGVVPIADMKELIADRTDSKPGTFGSFFKINPRVDDLPDELSVEHKGVKLLVLGTVKKGGGGCICPESVLLKTLISHMLFARDEALILDMEAGIEHLGRGTTASMDAMLVVIEPGLRSVQTAQSIRKLAADLGITRLFVVLNKLVDPEEQSIIEANLDGLPLLGSVSYDPELRRADLRGESPYDSVPRFVEEVRVIRTRLAQELEEKKEK